MEFSTSFMGWFGRIADDFTYENVRSLAGRLAELYKKNSSSGQKLIIGYDTRYFAKEFAEYFAGLMAGFGIKVFYSNNSAPSSVLVISSLHKKSLGTVVFTGDEHKASFLGVRAYNSKGHFLTDADLPASDGKKKKEQRTHENTFRKWSAKGHIEPFDPSICYENYLQKTIDFSAMSPSAVKFVYNPLHGSGISYFDIILKRNKINGYTVNREEVSDFGGLTPSPSAASKEVYLCMADKSAEVGFTVSPDCSSFDLLYGPHQCSVGETMLLIAEHLKDRAADQAMIVSEGLNANINLYERLGFQVVESKDALFYQALSGQTFCLAVDAFGRFYFNGRGFPDALTAGYYFLEYFNSKNGNSDLIESKIGMVDSVANHDQGGNPENSGAKHE